MSKRANELKKIQKQLCDEFITDTEKIDLIMNQYKQILNGFHNYSIMNLISAYFQHYEKTGESIEILASYKTWQKKGRQVKKGEKGLKILVPYKYKIKDEETDEVIGEKVYFKIGNVFDLSQTTGDRLEKDYTSNNFNITFNEITAQLPEVPVILTNKELERGSTDGHKIWISTHISDTEKICTLFHELAHMKLHFGKDRKKLTKGIKELEAETVSYIISSYLGIVNEESSSYIKHWYNDNPNGTIEGLGEKLINTANEIINELNLTTILLEKQSSTNGEEVTSSP